MYSLGVVLFNMVYSCSFTDSKLRDLKGINSFYKKIVMTLA